MAPSISSVSRAPRWRAGMNVLRLYWLELGEPVQVCGGLDGVRRYSPKLSFRDPGEGPGGRELDDRGDRALGAIAQVLGAQVPADRLGQLGHQLGHGVVG